MIIDKYSDIAPRAPMASVMPGVLAPSIKPADNASCVPQETVIYDVQLAHAYVPFEKLCTTFTPMTGLKNGTIFPPLMNGYGWERKGMGGMDDE
jgi:hypothetical protein